MAITGDYQFEFNGLKIGDTTDYDGVDYQGFGMPSVRSSDVEIVGRHGLAPGTDRFGARFVELALEVDGVDKMSALATAFRGGDFAESPLSFQIPGVAGGGTRRIMARCQEMPTPINLQRNLGDLPEVLLSLKATDPRIYDETETATVAALQDLSGGLTWPLTWPLNWGASSSGIVTVNNAGNFEAGATLTIPGPVTTPRVENITAGKTLRFDLTVADGQTLTVDLENRTVLLGTANRRSAMTVESSWWKLEPGDNEIRYGASTATTSNLTIRHRSAWIA